MTIKAREVGEYDDSLILDELGRQFFNECESGLEYDQTTMVMAINRITSAIVRDTINCWIVFKDRIPIGFCVGHISGLLYSKQTEASMLLWYVQPKYRKTRAAFELLHNFENWATIYGASRIVVGAGHMNAELQKSINAMFRHRKFREYGAIFYRDIEGT